MRMSMRPATDADAEWLFTLHEAAVRARSEEVHGTWDAEEQRHRFAARNETDVRVVAVDGESVGAVHLADAPDGALHIGLLEVHPDWQGRGIGTSVLRALDEEAARAGRDLTLRVRRGNPALRLYERLGFVAASADETHTYMRRS